MSKEHTPLPWVQNPVAMDQICDAAATTVVARVDTRIGTPVTTTLANGALIVKAVNNHQKLVDALRLAMFAMGKAGANADTKHAQRFEWEMARALLAELEAA